jgi:ubiquinone/menaquinone biosynthesis C-methylase UbiE
MADLFAKDAAELRAGMYRVPPDQWEDLWTIWKNARHVFQDLKSVRERQQSRSVQEFSNLAIVQDMPKYFAQTFHFQTDGYLSDHSASLYDHQVEMVFGGAADAMRRQSFWPLKEALPGLKDASEAPLVLDVACGTGRYTRFLKYNLSHARVIGVDLSPPYIEKAQRDAARLESTVDFIVGNAEELPVEDRTVDAVVNVFLFHELPRRVREKVAREFYRVLKPGGRIVFVDSVQNHDCPEYKGSLEHFPRTYHEPYYEDYVQNPIEELFESVGFRITRVERAFFSKVVTADRSS